MTLTRFLSVADAGGDHDNPSRRGKGQATSFRGRCNTKVSQVYREDDGRAERKEEEKDGDVHISCIVPTHPFSSARACCFCHPRTSCIPQQIHQHHNQCQSSPLSPPFSLLSHQVQRNAGLHLQDSKDGRRRGCIQRDRSRVVPPNHLHVHRDGEGYTHTATTFSFGCLLDFPPPSRRQHKHLLQLLALLSVHCLPIFRLAPLVARVPSPSTKAKHARQACRHNRNRARVTFPAVSSSPPPPSPPPPPPPPPPRHPPRPPGDLSEGESSDSNRCSSPYLL